MENWVYHLFLQNYIFYTNDKIIKQLIVSFASMIYVL